MDKKYVKNLVIRRVLPVTFALLSTGCSAFYEAEDAEVSIAIQEVTSSSDSIEQNDEQVLETDFSRDSIDSNGNFFEKVSSEKIVTWDDVILTNQERGIETFGSTEYERLLTDTILIERDQLSSEEYSIIDRLNVRRLARACFPLPVVTDYIEEHAYSSLYLEENNDLDWDQLFFTLKINLEKYQKKLQSQIDDPEKEDIKEVLKLKMIEEFSDDDLKKWVQQFHEFVLETREKIENLDIQRLACVLENYVVGYVPQSPFNLFSYAQCSKEHMTYPIWGDMYPNLDRYKQINYHEFYHLLSFACIDEETKKVIISSSGICLQYFNWDDEMLLKFGMKDDSYYPFDYIFLAEGNAERYGSSLCNQEPMVYFDKQFMIHNLIFSLFLQPDFDRDSFYRAELLHNPIAFIQQFPVLNVESEEWLYMQLEMLECYNIIYSIDRLVQFYWDAYQVDPDSVEETIVKRIPVLENYADLQMFRNFAWLMINSSNTDRNDLTLEDCYYLLDLFESRLEKQRKIVCKNYELESLDTESYIQGKDQILKILHAFLNQKYHPEEIGKGTLSEVLDMEDRQYLDRLHLEQETVFDCIDRESHAIDEAVKQYYIKP